MSAFGVSTTECLEFSVEVFVLNVWSFVERMVQWLRLKSESGFSLEFHRCASPGFGTKPRYEAPGDLRIYLHHAQ